MSLRDVARPLDDGSGYDYPAIARALTLTQRMTLATVAAGRGEQVDATRSLHQLAEAGLVLLAGDAAPPALSMLGEAVVELGLPGLFD